MEERFIDKYDEWNQPEWTQVDMTYLQNLEENLEYYKTTIEMILTDIESEDEDCKKIECIKEHIDELKRELN